MAALADSQKKQIQVTLAREKVYNYSNLEYFLKQIIQRRPVEFKTEEGVVVASPKEAWEIISSWAASTEGGLPVGDRGSINLRATRLLDYLQNNLIGKSTEVAASYHLILDQAKLPVFKDPPTTQKGKALDKALRLRRAQIDLLQEKFVGKLSSNLLQTKILASIPDAETRTLVLQMIATNSATFRNISDFTPEKINHLLLHLPGHRQVNNAIHVAYSNSSEQDFLELEQKIDQTIEEVYSGNEDEYLADLETFRSAGSLAPGLNNIETMIEALAPNAPANEKALLGKALRTKIVSLASEREHQDGYSILSDALAIAGLDQASLNALFPLTPYLEEIEVRERSRLLGTNLSDRSPQLIATSKIARDVGVDLNTPWLKSGDIVNLTNEVLQQYGATTLEEAFLRVEDPKELVRIQNLISARDNVALYQGALQDNIVFRVRHRIAQARGNYLSVTAPASRFYNKIMSEYEGIHHEINKPFASLADWWLALEERYPILNPNKLIVDKWLELQLNIASRVNIWSKTLSESDKWYSVIGQEIHDFTKGFIKNEGSWAGATHFFFEKKWGNLLDWTAKKFGLKSFDAAKLAIWEGVQKIIVAGGNKIAAGLGSKIAVTLAGIGTSSAGIGLVILGAQIVWELGKIGFKKLKDFITNAGGFRDKVLNWLPITIGAVAAFAMGIPALLVGAATGLVAAGIALIAGMAAALAGLFTLAAGVSLAIVASFLLLFYVFKPTTELDSGVASLVASAICEQSNLAIPSATANVALCIAELANKCPGINPMTESVVASPQWQCFVGGLVFKNAVAELEKSSHVKNGAEAPEGNVQCVGLSAAAAADGDGAFSVGQINACSYAANVPSGYNYLSGCPNMQPGDHFVMGVDECGDTVGHIGVVVAPDGGAGFSCVDANFLVPGEIRGPESCHFANSQISGCLRKI